MDSMYLVTYNNPLSGIYRQIMFVCQTEAQAVKSLLPYLHAEELVSTQYIEQFLIFRLNQCLVGHYYMVQPVRVK